MAVPKPSAGGSALSGKIGPVPKKAAVFIVVAVGVFLFLHFRKGKSASTSSGAQPAPSDASPYTAPSDSTGGGASGASQFDPSQLLSGLLSDNQAFRDIATAGTGGTYYYYPSTGQPNWGGGNTSTPVAADPVTSTTPTTSFPTDNSAYDFPAYLPPAGGESNYATALGASSSAGDNLHDSSSSGGYGTMPPAVTHVPGTPLSSATMPKPTKPPASGYAQSSRANLH